MPHPDRDLTDLAAEVADGSSPDWTRAESSATDDRSRGLIARLREISQIHRAHDSASDSTGRDSSTEPATAAGTSAAPAPIAWGSLRILEKVGSGRFGDVFRAFDPRLDREVALKLLRHRRSGRTELETIQVAEEGDAALVIEEGRLAARVRHPNVVTIYGAERIDGQTGLWMEFVEGRTLEAELAEHGPFDARALKEVGIELTRALGAVHDAGLVHRDVKATNVMRDRSGRIVLGDFGTGRELEESQTTRRGLAGTPAYLAPEIFAHQPATPQSDLYSLGVLLFHLATGRYPVPGKSLRDIREAHTKERPTPVQSLQPELPDLLAACIDRALDPNPARRFADARSMETALSPATPVALTRIAIVGLTIAAVVVVLTGVLWIRNQALGPGASSFKARDWVLVTRFENRTGESTLDGTIEIALERELADSSFVNVVPRERVEDALQLMATPVDTPVDGALALDVARKDTGIKAIVTGWIEKTGSAYRVNLQISGADTGRPFSTLVQDAPTEVDLPAAVREQAIGLRRALGEPSASIEASQRERRQLAAPSPKALLLYYRAVQQLNSARPQPGAAEQLLRAAIADDPNLPAAWLLLANTIAAEKRPPEEYLPPAERASQLADRASALERLVIVAELHALKGGTAASEVERREIEQSISTCDALLRLKPDHLWALTLLRANYDLLDRRNDAAEVLIRLSDIRPNTFYASASAAQVLLRRGEIAAARHYKGRAAALLASGVIKRDPHLATSVRLFEVSAAWLSTDGPQMLKLVDAAAAAITEIPSPEQLAYRQLLVDFYLTLGRFQQAEQTAREIQQANSRNHARAIVLSERGDLKELRELMAGDYRELTGRFDPQRVPFLVRAGMLAEAEAELQKLGPEWSALAVRPRAELLLAQGRRQEAIALFEQIIAKSAPQDGSAFGARLGLSRAWEADGNLARAVEVLETGFSRRPASLELGSGRLHGWQYIAARARLARLYRQIGREVRPIEFELANLLAVADRDHPVVVQLRDRGGR